MPATAIPLCPENWPYLVPQKPSRMNACNLCVLFAQDSRMGLPRKSSFCGEEPASVEPFRPAVFRGAAFWDASISTTLPLFLHDLPTRHRRSLGVRFLAGRPLPPQIFRPTLTRVEAPRGEGS
jgi:hypothetical protein